MNCTEKTVHGTRRHNDLPAAARSALTVLIPLCLAGCIASLPIHGEDETEFQPANPAIGADAAARIGTADSESAQVYFETAQKFERISDLENAATNYRRALTLAPDHLDAQLHLSNVLAQMGNKDQAVSLLRDLLTKLDRLPPDRRTAKIRDAAETSLLELDEIGLALAEAAFVLTDYAKAAERADRHENALQLYQKALEIWPACKEARERSRQLSQKYGLALSDEPSESTPSSEGAYLELSELTPASATVKADNLRVDETKWGLPIYNQGHVYDRGLWAPAPSKLVYALDGAYARLSVTCLVSAFKGSEQQTATLEKELRKPRSGTVVFTVIGDGQTLYTSDTVTYELGPVPVTVDVSGVKTLELVATDADGVNLLDFAVWADGRLYMKK